MDRGQPTGRDGNPEMTEDSELQKGEGQRIIMVTTREDSKAEAHKTETIHGPHRTEVDKVKEKVITEEDQLKDSSQTTGEMTAETDKLNTEERTVETDRTNKEGPTAETDKTNIIRMKAAEAAKTNMVIETGAEARTTGKEVETSNKLGEGHSHLERGITTETIVKTEVNNRTPTRTDHKEWKTHRNQDHPLQVTPEINSIHIGEMMETDITDLQKWEHDHGQ